MDRVDDGLLLDGVGAGLPSDGRLSRPTRDVKAILRAQSDATGTSGSRRAAAFPAFATLGYMQQPVPAAAHPYALAAAVPIADSGMHDADGVRMVRIGTTLFDHPVAQAPYGLANVASYDLTGDHRFSTRAIAQATRLVDTKIVSRDAWYFPYPFDFALHGRATETIRAPWYSAMAQGMALSLFVGLLSERTTTPGRRRPRERCQLPEPAGGPDAVGHARRRRRVRLAGGVPGRPASRGLTSRSTATLRHVRAVRLRDRSPGTR